ncbi:glycosyltransferase N-terminal domain-containing protein [Pseudobowmanella zhangzhouensis]|uniref:glycosyltransferase N-terminal domain-containing protein n=1 Tax=Pseudobowmanella zhangzhouensis TaxID=1537679 RepID=UPI003621BDA1
MALSPLLAISLWRKKRALGKTADNEWQQRLGFGFPAVNPGSWLLHCASMGEVSAAAPLIRALLDRGVRLTLTTSTAARSSGGAIIPGTVNPYLSAVRLARQHVTPASSR